MALSGGSTQSKLIAVLVATLLCGGAAWWATRESVRAKVTGEKPEERSESLSKITAKRPPGAAQALVRAAEDPSPRVRRTAMVGLTRYLNAAHRPVIEKGAADPDPGVRAIAAENLGAYRDKPAADVLVQVIRDDSDEKVRLAALRGLTNCNDPRAVVVLLQTAESGKTNEIKLQAMKGLLRKFKGRLSERRNPADVPGWRDLIQRWKMDLRVKDAFAKVGVRLDSHPEDLLGKDYHPERRGEAVGPVNPVVPDSLDRPEDED